jgi:L,D-peptidoglycan transpeptidase YkuD (ErfK/YbiS/YcfS/YnhG family)
MLQVGAFLVPCALGRSGQRWLKREGDGATPCGAWRLLELLVRPGVPHGSILPTRQLKQEDGWCDASDDANYNRRVRRPYPASHEKLWRADTLYDVVVVLDYNLRPRVRGRGSAVFFHLAENLAAPTAGCVAVQRRQMLRLLEIIGRNCRLIIRPPGDAGQKLQSRPVRRSRRP